SLRREDHLILVRFDAEARVLVASDLLSHTPFLDAIAELDCESGTNIQAALERAGSHLMAVPGNRLRRLIVLTDGQASVGLQAKDPLARISAALAANGVPTTALGFGLGYDEDLLSAVARAGGG